MKKYLIMLVLIALSALTAVKIISGKDTTAYNEAMENADSCMKDGYYIDAAAYYEKALTEQRNDKNAMKGRLSAYKAAGNDADFCSSATEFIKKTGGDAETFLLLADHYYSMGQYDTAYGYIDSGLKLSPDDAGLKDLKNQMDGSYIEYLINGTPEKAYSGKYAVIRVEDYEEYETDSENASETDSDRATYLQIIDDTGNVVLSGCRFSEVYDVYEPETEFEEEDGIMVSGVLYGETTPAYIDANGNRRRPPEDSDDHTDDYRDKRCEAGSTMTDTLSEATENSDSDYIPFQSGDKWGYKNSNGDILVEACFEETGNVSEYGSAICKRNGMYVVIKFNKFVKW